MICVGRYRHLGKRTIYKTFDDANECLLQSHMYPVQGRFRVLRDRNNLMAF